jgi:phosphatidyl-myo-inositol alpha-mannosyltransferase
LGFVSERDKASLLASAELAVFPSLGGESFGIVLIEAMAAGAGVVLGGNNLGYKSVLGSWPSTLFDPRDTPAFSNCLQRFLDDEHLRAKVYAQQQTAVKQYDVHTVGNQVLQLYTAALLHHQQEMR